MKNIGMVEDRDATSSMPDIAEIVRKHTPDLQPYEKYYKDFHENPELGKQESRTAGIVKKHLQVLGYEVHSGIGGHGVVGVFKNGSESKVLLLRADMDALPVEEETGLPYSSHVHQKDDAGNDVPVMHACGHDMNTTCLMAAAQLLLSVKAEWNGTLICLFQPNEESGQGAKAMVDDGLYNVVPVPDLILGQHVNHTRVGNVAICEGELMAAADSFAVTINGRGAHASQPELSVDPIMISAYVLVRLQSIVSRMTGALETAVVTCGSIRAGHAENVIPDTAHLKLNVRTFDPSLRTRVLAAMKEIILAECRSANAPRDPVVEPTSWFPLTKNDAELASTVRETFKMFFGEEDVKVQGKLPFSEDFSNLAAPNETPYAFWFFGGTEAARWDEAERKGETSLIPRNHSSRYYPVIQPTMITGVQAISVAALRFLC
jgi:amidohydrolase